MLRSGTLLLAKRMLMAGRPQCAGGGATHWRLVLYSVPRHEMHKLILSPLVLETSPAGRNYTLAVMSQLLSIMCVRETSTKRLLHNLGAQRPNGSSLTVVIAIRFIQFNRRGLYWCTPSTDAASVMLGRCRQGYTCPTLVLHRHPRQK